MCMYVALYIEVEASRTAADRMFAVARYYDISSKADRGDIFIIHNQKSSYRTLVITVFTVITIIMHLFISQHKIT